MRPSSVKIPGDILWWAKETAASERRSLSNFIAVTLEAEKARREATKKGGQDAANEVREVQEK